MRYLFSEVGLKVLESLSFAPTLYAFDFDGTLAPIVSRPESASARADTESLLLKLARFAPVVVISGRSVADLRSRVRLARTQLIGNHGLEGLGSKKESIEQAKKSCRAWLRQLMSTQGSLSTDPGILVEDKTYSLALHYRASRNKRTARRELLQRIERLSPAPRVIPGKCVINLVPHGGPHKGIALADALSKLELGSAFYIGDDDTDEDVFSLPDDRIITARVGSRRSSRAQFFIRSQGEINRLLRTLVRIHERASQE